MAEKICNCRECNGKVHVIGVGDTLYLLSRYYNVTVGELVRANKGINPYNLTVGEKICIPVRGMSGGNMNNNMDDDSMRNDGMRNDDRRNDDMRNDDRRNDNMRNNCMYDEKCERHYMYDGKMNANSVPDEKRDIKTVDNYDIEFLEVENEEMSMKEAVEKMTVKEFAEYIKKSYL